MRKFLLIALLALPATQAAAQETSPLERARAAIPESGCRADGRSSDYVRGTCRTLEAATSLYTRFRELRNGSYQVFQPNCTYNRAEEPRTVIECSVQIERR